NERERGVDDQARAPRSEASRRAHHRSVPAPSSDPQTLNAEAPASDALRRRDAPAPSASRIQAPSTIHFLIYALFDPQPKRRNSTLAREIPLRPESEIRPFGIGLVEHVA